MQARMSSSKLKLVVKLAEVSGQTDAKPISSTDRGKQSTKNAFNLDFWPPISRIKCWKTASALARAMQSSSADSFAQISLPPLDKQGPESGAIHSQQRKAHAESESIHTARDDLPPDPSLSQPGLSIQIWV